MYGVKFQATLPTIVNLNHLIRVVSHLIRVVNQDLSVMTKPLRAVRLTKT